MDEKTLEKIKLLINLFEDRERLHQLSTEKILDYLGPTVLEGLYTLFNAPYENVTWLETQLVEDIVLIVASIEYDHDEDVPDIIQALSPMPVTGQPSIRLFRVGVPLDMVFTTKEEIAEYLTGTAQSAAKKLRTQMEDIEEEGSVPVEIEKQKPQQTEFDTSELTHDQKQQLLMYNEDKKGTKH